jgi:hypothetical protein
MAHFVSGALLYDTVFHYSGLESIMRAETGPMEFEDDWRGVFIRGDNALLRYIPMLKSLRDKLEHDDTFQGAMDILCLDDLIGVLASANHHQDNKDVQKMKRFENCVK